MTSDPISIAFSGSLTNRASAERLKPDWVARELGNPGNRYCVIVGENIAVKMPANGGFPDLLWVDLTTLQDQGISTDNVVLLGIDDDELPHWSLSVSEDELAALGQKLEQNCQPFPLRSLAAQGHLSTQELAIASHAKALVDWHDNHRFCSTCGTVTEIADAGARRVCPSCEASHFPRVNPVAIMLTIDGDNCLLGRQARFPPGVYTALAGFMEPGETIEECVRRETFEESGVRVGEVRYIASQYWPFPSNLMIGCHADALSADLDPDFEEMEDVRWFTRKEVQQMLADEHPDQLRPPAEFAIAHQLLKVFANRD